MPHEFDIPNRDIPLASLELLIQIVSHQSAMSEILFEHLSNGDDVKKQHLSDIYINIFNDEVRTNLERIFAKYGGMDLGDLLNK